MNKINIRCCLKTAEKLLDIHLCDYAIIAIVSLCFVMLISKHDIIVKQSEFVRESFSRLSRKTVVKALAALGLYSLKVRHNFNFHRNHFKIIELILIQLSTSKLSDFYIKNRNFDQ